MWYNCFDEVAGENMKMLIELFWMDKYRKWRKENFLEFQYMNIFSNLKREVSIKNNNELNFLDRWVFDWIASLKRENYNISKSIESLVNNINYDYIFIIEPIGTHNIREHTWRMLDENISIKWSKFIINEYISRFWKKKVINVPFDTIENRAKFILDKINLCI